MKLQEQDVQPAGLASVAVAQPKALSPLGGLVNFVVKTGTIVEWEVRKLRHDATDIVTRAIQPALWLVIFGEVFAQIRAIPTGRISYLDYLSSGILAQSVLFLSIFTGIAVIWERDLGVIHKFLASPTPRGSLVLGKALATGVKALPQALVIYLLALVLGVHMNFNPLHLLGVIVLVVLGAACFSTFSLIIACLLKTRDRVMGIGQVLTMPLFFASNAIYPIAIMPRWLQAIAHANPLTYLVDGLRELMLVAPPAGGNLALDFVVLLCVTAVLVTIGSLLYPRIVQ